MVDNPHDSHSQTMVISSPVQYSNNKLPYLGKISLSDRISQSTMRASKHWREVAMFLAAAFKDLHLGSSQLAHHQSAAVVCSGKATASLLVMEQIQLHGRRT